MDLWLLLKCYTERAVQETHICDSINIYAFLFPIAVTC